MSNSFRLPDLGEGVHEAEILSVLVKEGQAVTEGELILEIETDKAAVEIPSPYTGIVKEILVKTGDMATVGDVLITFSEKQPSSPAEEPQPKSKVSQAQKVIPASPSTRRLARELGIELHDVIATGTAGLVTREDVENHAKSLSSDTVALPEQQESAPEVKEMTQPAAEAAPDDGWGKIERVAFRSIRRATAKRMTASWTEIPHVHCQDNVDVTKLESFRQKHKEEIEKLGGRLTLTVFALKALATALKTYPYFNASLDLERQEIILKHYFNIGIAVDTPKGLMVPVVKDVDRKSIKELAIEVNQAITDVRQGIHTREQMVGGTFTITNAGALGGSHFTAIINHPEVAILGLGQARMQPAVITDHRGRDEIRPRLIMPLVLCFDHRVVDGADAIRFLRLIIESLEDPEELLITMI